MDFHHTSFLQLRFCIGVTFQDQKGPSASTRASKAASKACYLFRAGACTGGNINNSRSLSVLIMYTMLNVLSEHNQDV